MRLPFRSVLVSLFIFSVAIGPAEAGPYTEALPSDVASGFLGAVALAEAASRTDIVIQGVVSDPSGAVIAGATVDAFVAGRIVATATTGADGRYQVAVPAGTPVELRVRRAGFADHVVSLTGGPTAMVRDVTLQVGGVSDSLVVTASRAAESRAALTESVTSFARADLDALGASSLADVVRFVPGAYVESIGREGSVTSMFTRGGESDYNLVLIDGVRVNQSGGVFDFSRISAAEIDRVEVVRGAQSALWGSDAMGSVVQIFTRRTGAADRPQLSGSAEGGSFGAFRGDARLMGGASSRVDYSGGLSRRQSGGAFAELLPEEDAFAQTAFDAGVGASFGPRVALKAGARSTSADGKSVGAITYGARNTGGVYNTRDRSGHVDLSHAIGPRLTGIASVNYFRYTSESADTIADPAFATYAVLEGTPNAIYPNGTRLVRLVDAAEFATLVAAGATPGPGQFLASRQSSNFPFRSKSEFERPALRYQADYAWAGQRFSAGYEWERETNVLVAGVQFDNQALFVQQQLSARDRWFATAGGRFDRKDASSFFSPKLSAGGYLVPFRNGAVSSLKVRGNLGHGIKSPSLSERFGGPFTDPAPDLRVEQARTSDLGVEATFASQRFRALVTYFNNDYTDQIAYRGGVSGDGIPEYINIDGSKADGWELEWALQRPVAGLTASASYTQVDHRVVTNVSTSQQFQPGQPLLRRPKHSGHVRAAWVRARVSVNASARIAGDRHDHSFLSLRTVPNAARPTPITTDITVNPGYLVVSLGLDLRAHQLVTFYVRGENVADRAYESVLGYPAMPRTVMAGARFTFGAGR
ncbi:MAG: TonB-dependent receptor [Acidobacteriota bacterium]|nr:TonB-dependent receptor [Acidobacteriota bacterium]